MNRRSLKWDKFVHSLLICIVTAQRKYKYFVVGKLDPNNPQDLLFFRLTTIAATFVKTCTVYGYVPGLKRTHGVKFTALHQIKLSDAPFGQAVPYEVMELFGTNDVHVCTATERTQLIEKVAEQCEMDINDIPTLYKEYYSR